MTVYGVVLKLDEKVSRQIEDIWALLAGKGLASYMPDNNYKPHVTLGVCEQMDSGQVIMALDRFSQGLTQVKLSLSFLGLFAGEESAVYLGVTPTRELLDLHNRFHETFCRYSKKAVGYFDPDNWVPHCSVAVKMEPENLSKAVEVIKDVRLPMAAYATELTVVEAPPWKELATFSLSKE